MPIMIKKFVTRDFDSYLSTTAIKNIANGKIVKTVNQFPHVGFLNPVIRVKIVAANPMLALTAIVRI